MVVTAFIGLMILVPFLNQFMQNISEDVCRKVLVALFIILVIPPTNTWSNDLMWFIAVYLTAGYIRMYGVKYLTTQKRRIWVGISCFAIMWLASIVFSVVALKVSAIEPYINYFAFRQNSPFMYIGSTAFFLYVLGLKTRYSKIINKMAKHVLPCYLIQSNVFFSGILWKTVDSLIPRGLMYPLVVVFTVVVLVAIFMLFDTIIEAISKFVKTNVKRVMFKH